MKLNKTEDQHNLLKSIEKAIRAVIESEVQGTSSRISEASVTIEPLQPSGWKLLFKVGLQVSELDVKKIAPPEG